MLNKRILVLMFLLLFLPLVGCLTPPNQAPILTSSPVTTATVGVLYTYDVNATDPNGDILTYSLTVKPGGMSINSANGVINWTPVPTQIGDNPVTVKVSDGTLSITQNFTIKVSTFPPVNQAPVIYSTPVTIATVGITYFYDVNATDPNGDTLTYSLTTKPSGMFINSVNGLIWWTPIAKGTYTVVVNVSDGALSDTQGFNIVVSKPTVPPETHTITASAGPGGSISPLGDVTVDEGKDISFTITPNANYGIEKVLVDGGSVGAVAFYTFTNVAKDHTIHVTFSAVEPEPEVEFTGIEVSPDKVNLFNLLYSQQLTVTAYYSNGTSTDITSDCNYGSSNSSIASVSANGLVKAEDFGKTTITVAYTTKGPIFTVTVEVTVGGPVYNVTRNTYHNNITDAISEALAGDTIEVAPGVYYEQVTIKKSVTLISDTGDYRTTETILMGPGPIFSINADGITVQGFGFNEVILSGGGQGAIHCGITAHDIVIQSNSFTNLGGPAVFGMPAEVLPAGTGWLVTDNKIDAITGPSASGLRFQKLTDSEISKNEISNTAYGGMILDNLENVVISGNTISNTPRKGIQVAISSNVVIEKNHITNTNTSHDEDEGAITIYPDVTNIHIQGNTLTANYQGFTVRDMAGTVSDVHVNFNNIYGNDGFGVGNFANGGGIVDATNNWWGDADASGPYHPTTNPDGLGNAVSDNVDFFPWE